MQNVPEKQPVETDRSFDTHMAEEHGQNRPVIHRERERGKYELIVQNTTSSTSPQRHFNVSWGFTDVYRCSFIVIRNKMIKKTLNKTGEYKRSL